MRKLTRKLVACFTSFCLVFSMIGFPAVGFADDGNASEQGDGNGFSVATVDGDISPTEPVDVTLGDSQVSLGAGSVELLAASNDQEAIDEAAAFYVKFSAYGPAVSNGTAGKVDISYTLRNKATGATRGDSLTNISQPTTDVPSMDESDEPVLQDASNTGDNPQSMNEYYSLMTGLEPGTYELTAQGKGYMPYSQEIELKAHTTTEIALYDSGKNDIGQDAAAGKRGAPGVMPFGDLDGNGSINESDATLLVNSIGSKNASAHLDLYGDAGVSLSDVQFFADFFADGQGKAQNAEPRYPINADSLAMEVDSSSLKVQGDGDVFTDDGTTLTYTPVDPATGEEAEISQDTPVVMNFNTKNVEMEGLQIRTPVDSEGMVRSGYATVITEDGTPYQVAFGAETAAPQSQNLFAALANGVAGLFGLQKAYADDVRLQAAATVNDGLITIDFGARVAVKRIIITVTETTGNKLAEIAKVEFLNDTEDRIDVPELSTPEGLVGVPGKKSFRVNWNPALNVTGYEVMVALNGKSTMFSSVLPTLDVQRLFGNELSNETTYEVKVRSVNGDWRSPWTDSIYVTPKATAAPPAPLGVTATGAYGEIEVKWSSAEDAKGYILYYRQKGTANYTEVRVSATNYRITPLDLNVTYEGFVRAYNDIGTSPNSRTWEATTVGAASVKVPWYNLINRKAQDKSLETHVTQVTPSYPNNENANPGFDPMDVVDGDYNTYYYSSANGNYYGGVTVTFDDVYEMDSLALTTYLAKGFNSFHDMRVGVNAGDGSATTYYFSQKGQVNVSSVASDGKTAPSTYWVQFPKSKVKSITVGFQRAYYAIPTISELAFYKSDGLQERLDNLWKPEALFTELADDVTAETLSTLKADIEATDPACGEQHPRLSLLLNQWQLAKDVFDNKDSMTAPVKVDPSISRSTNAYVSGLSALQPLGVTVRNGDDVTVYVGRDSNLAVGANTPLRLWVSQYHGDSGAQFKQLKATLTHGRNDLGKLDLSGLPSAVGEQGGALYVEYDGSNRNQDYTVRVIGGTAIPVLDLHGVADMGERVALCNDYISELRTYTQGLAADHASKHQGTYNAQECMLNTTDIVLDRMMFSIPAAQALAGIGSGDGAQLEANLAKGDEMMNLFYQHKGLTDQELTAAEKAKYGEKNGIPTGRQNIRYANMAGGVFMYAAGNHIGVQYGQTAALTGSTGAQFDANGRWLDGQYYGWGHRHEVGHEVNQSQYTYAEITNNYYSQLGGMVDEGDDNLRWTYDSVYKRVTSGTKGMTGGKTGIALYWQLHLAYDDGYNYKQYDSYTEQMENLVFARMDSIARNPSTAPVAANGGIAFSLSGADKDNALMRLACAATQKNLLAFFEAWGLTPDDATRSYASQWPVEERAIQYISDSTREYRITGGSGASRARVMADESNGKQGMEVTPNSSTVTFNLANDTNGNGNFWGYEILRDGTPVGFVKAGADGKATYTDTIATVNNRVFKYSVRGVDKLMNYTEALEFEPVKISHNGSIEKAGWTLTSNLYPGGVAPEGDEDYHGGEDQELPSAPELDNLKDNNASTSFSGKKLSGDNGRAQITIDFGGNYAVWALQATGDGHEALKDCTIQVSTDGTNFTTVTPGEVASSASSRTTTQYFGNPAKPDDRQLHAYDASYLRILAPAGSDMPVLSELDVLAPTTDDIEFLDDSPAVGYLAADYDLAADGSGSEGVIPQGSLVFIGRFTGNVAYNAVKLYDADTNRLIGGSQVFFADIPEEGNLGKTADGRWVYYIEPGDALNALKNNLANVRAELYRVDDALTLEGERLVAETLPLAVPWGSMDNIHLTDDRS